MSEKHKINYVCPYLKNGTCERNGKVGGRCSDETYRNCLDYIDAIDELVPRVRERMRVAEEV